MKDDHKNSIITRYQERLQQHGPGIQALASGTEERRQLRFGVLSQVGIFPGCSILDVGCGLADYYGYLKECGLDINYTGVDIVPDLINHAQQKYPQLDVQVRDIQENPFPPQSYDFVVASQVFNYKFEQDPLVFVGDMLSLMFRTARCGVAVDFVTSYVDFRQEHLNYYAPEAILGLAKTLSKRVTIRHDYPLFEFCLYVFPDFQGWSS